MDDIKEKIKLRMGDPCFLALEKIMEKLEEKGKSIDKTNQDNPVVIALGLVAMTIREVIYKPDIDSDVNDSLIFNPNQPIPLSTQKDSQKNECK